MSLLKFTDYGIYCEKGDFFIDPLKPVKKALITHGHSDHARPNSKYYLAHHDSIPVLKLRLGSHIKVQGISYAEVKQINNVKVSFHPAGHILGSSQIKVTDGKETWVISGDYKLEDDGISTPFEPVKCTHFITESTFGLPVYNWENQEVIFNKINHWWQKNQQEGKTSVLFAYALGKAQRLIKGLDKSLGEVFLHGAVWNVVESDKKNYKFDINIHPITKDTPPAKFKQQIIVAPPSAFGSPWMRKFNPYTTGIASGWMAIRGMKRRRAVDTGFVMSDHADWKGLLKAVKESEAENIFVTHGYTDIFSKYLQEQGYNSQVVATHSIRTDTDQDDL
ncbi:MAG: DNA ligase-associated DEXH box helicase [Thalassobius sp.]|nr:DNA ligase-associated DEXH box helicase [Thalassovita sp.]